MFGDGVGLEADPHTFLDIAPIGRAKNLGAVLRDPRKIPELAKDMARRKARELSTDIARLLKRGTPERNKIETARSAGVDARKAQELENILGGGKGSGVWTKEELEKIRRTRELPEGVVVWHHDPTVANRPDLAADPSAVRPIRGGRKEHFEQGHNRNWQEPRE